jgi:hypothetical protein
MCALISFPRSLPLWLLVLLSPTAYFVLLLLADTFHVPSPPEAVVRSLFYFIPPVAALVCGSIVWSSNLTPARKMRWLLLTLLAVLLQAALLLALFVVAAG